MRMKGASKMKTTKKEIRNLISVMGAIDATNYDNIVEAVEILAYSVGIYGVNAVAVKGRETAKIYVVLARNSLMFKLI